MKNKHCLSVFILFHEIYEALVVAHKITISDWAQAYIYDNVLEALAVQRITLKL